jgi:hypothetical protein
MIDFVSESAVQEKEFNPNDERDEAPREGDMVNHKDLGKVSVVKVTGSDQMGQPAEYMVQAKLSYDELMGDVELGKFESAVQEDISDKGRIALEKAGFDPMKAKEYMAVFNDHGDTSDIDQMNMDKVGLADAMSMVLASHGIQNESAVQEDAGEEQASQKLAQHFQEIANEYKASGDTSDEYEEMQDIATAFRTKGIQAGIDEINDSRFEFSSDPFGRQEYELEPADKDVVDLLRQAGYTHKIVKDPNATFHTFNRKVVLQKIGKEVSEDSGELARLKELAGIEEEENQLEGLTFEDIKPYVSMYTDKDGKKVNAVLDKDGAEVFKTHDAKAAMAYLSQNYDKLKKEDNAPDMVIRDPDDEADDKDQEIAKDQADAEKINTELDRIKHLANIQ